jgi:hypothetical protein
MRERAMTRPRKWLQRLSDELDWVYQHFDGFEGQAPSRRAAWLWKVAHDEGGTFGDYLDLYVLARCALSGTDTSWSRSTMQEKEAMAPLLAALFRRAMRAAAVLEAASVCHRYAIDRPAWSEGVMFQRAWGAARVPPVMAN